ncbi:MAG TPA: alpha/beta hydrolase [Kofleriaceae bacterium]|nr:alpha/beta hydrolase [Kofleriaceae bacterium]
MRSRRLALSTGLTYHVLDWDAAKDALHPDTTFVLVHGFLDLAFGWREVAERIAKRAHVVAPDLRGHGDSDWIGPGGYYHYMDYCADLDALIPRVVRKRLVLVGHSMGGGVASYWAGTRPDKIAALALLEGIGPPDQDGAQLPARTAQWIDAWRGARTKSVKPMSSLADAAARLRKHDPLLGEALALELAKAGTRPVEDGLAWKHDPLHLTMGPYPFRREAAEQYWKRVTCPVLVVDGEKTMLNLPEAERAVRRAAFANHRHVVLPGAGHMMQRHQPAALAELLLELA